MRNEQDAEESVSDTYMKAWDTIPPQRPVHFFAYIAKICRNLALKRVDWKNAQKRSAEIVALTQEMEGAGSFSVPLIADANAGHSWAEAKG